MANINIKFNNKDYQLSCDDGQEESLKSLTKFLDKKYGELKDKLGNIGENKLLLITTIQLIDDYFNLKQRVAQQKKKLDDLANDMNVLESDLITKLEKIISETKSQNVNNNKSDSFEDMSIKEKNTLGTLVISDKNTPIKETEESTTDFKKEEETLVQELSNLNPEEQIQLALDQMMKKNYNKSKKILEEFITNFPDNKLSGSAHFWLGKIYLFETNYRKAAIVFGEGVQKFPKSIKAAEMYYELAKSLKEMNKIPESCKTLNLLEEKYKGNKFSRDPEKIKDKLNCEVNN